MKDILIKINRETRMVTLNKTTIGNDGESLQAKLIFSFEDEFVDGQARLEYTVAGQSYYAMIQKVGETYELPVLPMLTKKGQIDMQLVITEGTDEEEIPVFKSNKFYLYCNSSINAVDKAPEGYDLWIEQANVKLNQLDNIDIDLKDNVLTITKKDGTTKSENVKGDKGDKGDAGSIKFIIVSELPSENIDESAIYMIPAGETSEGNTYIEYIYVNGAWESLGSASVEVDLSNYPTKDEMDKAVANSRLKYLYEIDYDLGNNTPNNFTPADKTILKNKLTNIINDVYGKEQETFSLFLYAKTSTTSEVRGGLFTPQVRENKKLSKKPTSYDLYTLIQNGNSSNTLNGKFYMTQLAIYLSWDENDVATVTDVSFQLRDFTSVSSNNVLTKSNTTSYTPTANYHPATKLYVDNAIASAITTTLGGSY